MQSYLSDLVRRRRGWILYIFIAILIIPLYIFNFTTPSTDRFEPFGYIDKPLKLDIEPPGNDIIGPAVYPGGSIIIRARRCYRIRTLVFARSSWVRPEQKAINGDVVVARLVLPKSEGTREREPRCYDEVYENIVPLGFTPGVWQIVGYESASDGEHEPVLRHWETESFNVLPPP